MATTWQLFSTVSVNVFANVNFSFGNLQQMANSLMLFTVLKEGVSFYLWFLMHA